MIDFYVWSLEVTAAEVIDVKKPLYNEVCWFANRRHSQLSGRHVSRVQLNGEMTTAFLGLVAPGAVLARERKQREFLLITLFDLAPMKRRQPQQW